MPMIKNKALIHELFDLLREIKDDEEFAADIAVCLEDEDGFRSMIDFLKANHGNDTVGQALYEAAMIWQDKQPDEEFEADDQEQEKLNTEDEEIIQAICDACDNNRTVRIILKDGTIYTHALVLDVSFANDEEEFAIRTKEHDTDSFLEQTFHMTGWKASSITRLSKAIPHKGQVKNSDTCPFVIL